MKLDATRRAFFCGVADAAFANPFGDRRAALDSELSGDQHSEIGEPVDLFLARVGDELAGAGDVDVRLLEGADRRVVELTVLFDVFHRFAEPLDELIERQAFAGATPVAAPFVPKMLSALVERGFGAERAERLVGMFYQIRRAFFFISRSLPGTSPCMRQLRARVWQNVFTDDIVLYESTLWSRMEDFSTFFIGETGTGKGTAAAALGRSGWIGWEAARGRFASGFDDRFLAVNLSQFPESLIESELFGHRKGAFTGAIEAHDGLLGRVRPHGAIFLDEIGEVSESLQIKLLRVLQERTFTPVGSHESVAFPGRVLAATNRSPEQLRAEGKMRDDFYYRLCSDVIEVPPLRRRLAEDPQELPLLVDAICRRTLGHDDDTVSERVLDVIDRRLGANYAWPGNVRELEQCVRRVLLTRDYSGEAAAPAGLAFGDLRISAAQLVGQYCQALYEKLGSQEAVGQVVGMDRRTVARYLREAAEGTG